VSNTLAIAAVTATLRNLLSAGVALDPDLADTTFTFQCLDRARAATDSANQLNIFLYQASPNAAYRNMDPPQTKSGETGFPSLGLNLYYLLTTYGRDNDVQRPFSHQLLGRVMSIMHDHPVLGRDEIRSALAGNDLGDQLERIRFSLQPLTVDDSFRLWSGFQTQYRLSVAYEATVVLMSSTLPAKTPKPVLARGRGDSGIQSQPSVDSRTPVITNIDAPGGVFGAEAGQTVAFQGIALGGDAVKARFTSDRRSIQTDLAAAVGATDTSFSVVIGASTLPSGVYSIQALVATNPGKPEEVTRASLPVRFSVAPKITDTFPLNVAAVGGQATLTVNVAPPVQPNQEVSLLLNNDEKATGPVLTAPASSLTFAIAQAQPGTYLLRLRVDGADSLVIDTSAALPVFLDRTLTIT